MQKSFLRTENALIADHGAVSAWLLLLGLLLLGAWTAWAFGFKVTRYEVSDAARMEVAGAAAPIQAGLSGQVSLSHLRLGESVETGAVLIELNNRDQQLALAEEQTRRAQLEPQLSALRMQVEAEAAGRGNDEEVLRYSTNAAAATQRQAQSASDLAQSEAQRAAKLRAEGLISEADMQKAKALSVSARASAESLHQAELQLSPELKVRNSDRLAKQREIQTEIAKLDAQVASSNATLAQLRYEIERRKIRAPITGRLTECAVLHPGAHISEGQQLGVILPPGKVQMVANFNPAAAFGKLHPGQSARIRLDGYPWAQFGVIEATVSKVAGEIKDGEVRVELAIRHTPDSRIHLQHGLPGTVEVEVERVTPAAMLLRSAGQAMGAR